jgi:DNA-binding response OmpR family regulator
MTKKILLAIKNESIRKIYQETLKNEGFEVLTREEKEKIFELIKEKMPDLILVDVALGGFEILANLKQDEKTKRIPTIIFSSFGQAGEEKKALELEAKDFIVGALIAPKDVLCKIKIHLGEEKTYLLKLPENEVIKKLAQDLGYESLFCPSCHSPLALYLMRDLTRGKNYFKVSFICPKCQR